MNIGVIGVTLNHYSGIRAIVELCIALGKRGHQVTLYANNKDTNKDTVAILAKQQVKIQIVNNSLDLFVKLLKSKHDVLTLHTTLLFFLAARFSGKPVLATYYGTQFNAFSNALFPKKLPKILNCILDQFFNLIIQLKTLPVLFLSDKITTISRYCSLEAQQIFHKKIDFVYLAGGSIFTKIPLHTANKRFTILSISRFTPYKGFHQLIKVFGAFHKQHPFSRLILAGSRSSKEYLAYLKKRQGTGIEIYENPTDTVLSRLYSQSSVYVSFDRFLFFGMPAVEALSFGKPLLLLNKAAASELVDNSKNGYLFTTEPELLNQLYRLIQHPKLLKSMSHHALAKSLHFSWEKTANSYEKILSRLSQKNPNWFKFILLLLLGIILRILFLKQHDIWFDEAISYFIAKLPLNKIILAAAADNSPPFYYLILHYWTLIAPQSEIFLRLPSFIFSLASTFVAARVMKNFTHGQEVKTAILFLLFSPLLVYLSSETRNYSLFLFLSLLVLHYYYKFLKKSNFQQLILLIISLIFFFYTHYLALLFIPTLLILLWEKPQYKSKLPLIIFAFLIVFLSFIPWILYAKNIPHSPPYNYYPVKGIIGFFVALTLGDLRMPFFTPYQGQILFLGILILMATSLLKSLGRNKVILFAAFMPILLLALISFFQPIFSIRSLLIFLPFVYFLLASGVQKSHLVKLIIGSFIFLLLLQRFDNHFRFEQFRDASLFIQRNYAQIPLLHKSALTYYPFRYYLPQYNNILIGINPLSRETIKLIGGKSNNPSTLPKGEVLIISLNNEIPVNLDSQYIYQNKYINFGMTFYQYEKR